MDHLAQLMRRQKHPRHYPSPTDRPVDCQRIVKICARVERALQPSDRYARNTSLKPHSVWLPTGSGNQQPHASRSRKLLVVSESLRSRGEGRACSSSISPHISTSLATSLLYLHRLGRRYMIGRWHNPHPPSRDSFRDH